MNSHPISRFVQKLVGPKPSGEPLSLRVGIVDALNAGPPPTVSVFISGEARSTLGIRYLASYAPAPGDFVVMMKNGGDLWVQGAFAV